MVKTEAFLPGRNIREIEAAEVGEKRGEEEVAIERMGDRNVEKLLTD